MVNNSCNINRLKTIGTIAIVFFLSQEVSAMAFGNKLILFSQVNGVVLDHGKPVVGAKLERSYRWSWNDKEGVDHCTSDEKGNFYFKEIEGHSIAASLLPHQPVVYQKITISVGGKFFEAWTFGKMNYDRNGELHGHELRLVCDIAAEPTYKGKVYGIAEFR